jgi:hypothetical protein
MEEETGDWIKLRNRELHNLCFSRNGIMMIKSRWIRWEGHVESMQKLEMYPEL